LNRTLSRHGEFLATDRLHGVASDRTVMPLADQFFAGAAAACNTHALDHMSKLLWRAH
jgi:hypothetical protein